MGMGTETEPRIFISYARSDGNTAAARLRALLERHGFALWQDLVAMEGGEDWWRQIERVIKTKSLEYFILVMTPNAVASPIVRKEWRLARQEGKCVIPIVGSPVLDFSAMPPWMRRIDFIDPEIPERCTRLIRRLESPCIHRRVPFMAGDLPGDFVARPVELEAVVDRLLDQEKEEPVAITSVLTGAGGFGKTVLARAVCHDALIQDAFDGGVLWATLGEQPGDLIVKVVDLIEVLSGQRPGFQGMEAATSRLAEALGEGRYLIVVDDVWDAAHAQPFLSGGPNCARLITTRDRKTLPADAQKVTVDAMRRLEARQLLGSGLPTEHDNALDALARRLGEWPLALKLANGVLQRRTRRREPMLAALRHVNEALDEGGLTAFDANSAEDRADAVAATLAPSMKALTVEWPEGPARFAELTVFAEDADVPLSAIAALWAQSNMRKQQAERLCLELFDLSLLLSLDLEKRQIRLHDVIRGYFLPDDPAARRCLHRRLLNAYRGTCRKGWESGPNDGYFFQWLTYHLREAGETNELRRLLLDYRWLAAKLAATDIAALLGDYHQLDDDEGAKLVEGALRLSAHALGKEPSQLAPHLTG